MTALGIDIGSTSIKGAVLHPARDVGGAVGPVEKAPFPQPAGNLPAGWFEVDPQAVLDATRAVLEALLRQVPDADRLYLCGQMGGAVVCDATGHPLTPYLSWRDTRTTVPDASRSCLLSQTDKLLADLLPALGNELKPGSTTLLLHWLAQNGSLPAGGYAATIGDAVAAMLCGTAPRIHPTMAIGMLDLAQGGWHPEMLRRLGLQALQWLPPANLTTPVGFTRVAGRELQVFAVVGDQQCALLGAGLEPGELSLNVSTGAQVSRLVQRSGTVPHQTRHFLNGLFLETITHIPAGRSLHALVDLLTELSRAQGLPTGNPWQTITRLAGESSADAGGLEANIAFFPSAVGDSGSLNGIRLENLTAGNLLAAATRNLADNLTRCADRLAPGHTWQQVRLSGGLSRDLPLLKDLIQARFPGATLIESTQEEETLAGLASMAGGEGH
jgi:xylulokinase